MRFSVEAPVRKNLNLRRSTVRRLEGLSSLSGVPQGELVDRAFEQSLMRRMGYFVDAEQPVAELLDDYACGSETVMTEHVTEAYLNVILGSVLPVAKVRRGLSHDLLADLNSYVSVRLDYKCVGQVHEEFRMFQEMSAHGQFFVRSSDSGLANVRGYVSAMRSKCCDPDIYANANMLKSVVTMLREYLAPVDGQARQAQYAACQELFTMGCSGA